MRIWALGFFIGGGWQEIGVFCLLFFCYCHILCLFSVFSLVLFSFFFYSCLGLSEGTDDKTLHISVCSGYETLLYWSQNFDINSWSYIVLYWVTPNKSILVTHFFFPIKIIWNFCSTVSKMDSFWCSGRTALISPGYKILRQPQTSVSTFSVISLIKKRCLSYFPYCKEKSSLLPWS